METTEDQPRRRIGWMLYVIAGMSFIPLIGIPFGLIAIGCGLLSYRRGGKTPALVGAAGITFSALLYGGFYYFAFAKRGGKFDELRGELSRVLLTKLVREIEYHKLQNGQYPRDLREVKEALPGSGKPSIEDPTIAPEGMLKPFYYQLLEDKEHYILRGVGLDGMPFTADDVLPEISEAELQRTGLRLDR